MKSYYIAAAALQVTERSIRQKHPMIVTLRHFQKRDICLMHRKRKLKSYFFLLDKNKRTVINIISDVMYY